LEFANHFVLIGAALLVGSIVASVLSSRLGAPILLVFLALGMLAGEDGPGHIRFDDVGTAYLVGTLALAVILFDGGMRTRAETFRTGLWPAVSLATVGVFVTSAIVGVVAAWALHLSLVQGLLIGAIVGSTDAAAVFSVLHGRGVDLKQRVASTLEIESGSNDPMAIFLTILLVERLRAGHTSPGWEGVLHFVHEFGLGTVMGILGGKLVVWLINRLALASGLYPLLAAASGVLIFGLTNYVGGSGFLAIYLAGAVLGNSPLREGQHIMRVHDGLAWLAQITMFLMLGLLVTPSQLIEIAPQAMLIALVLILIARPVAVALSLLPFRFPWQEHVFISWVGLRGAVPMILALFPLIAGLPDARLFFNVAFFVVLISLIVQGWTVAPAARLLGLEVPPGSAPLSRVNLDIPGHLEQELFGYLVAPGALALAQQVRELAVPETAQVAAIAREGKMVPITGDLRLIPDDVVYIIGEPSHLRALNRLFDARRMPPRHARERFFGDFALNGDAAIVDLEALYGIAFAGRQDADTLESYLTRRFHKRPVVGDRLHVGQADIIIREMDGNSVKTAGLLLRR
jgi:potassium/hydrogen antiporter